MEELKSNSVSGRDYNHVYASASSGDIKAQILLGRMYRDGDGVEKNASKAVEWLTKAAENGSAEAQWYLGNMYCDGNGVVLSYSKALEWYTSAAELGDADAFVSLGVLYQHGRGVSKDFSKAAEYYAMAAAMGNDYGEFNLGALYWDGQGVPKNDQKAFEYLSRSAEKGNEHAQYLLGNIYFERQDYEKGKEYYRMAANQGHKSALEKLNAREGLEAKQKKEDSIKKFTCTVCKKQNPWGQKHCSHCSSIVKYAPAWKYVWLGVLTGVVTAGYGLTQGASLTEAAFAFVFPWLAVMLLAKLFGGTRAVSIP